MTVFLKKVFTSYKEDEQVCTLSFYKGWSWFKFNNLGMALGMALKFYIRVEKGLKLKVRKVLRLILTFAEVTGEKLVVQWL